MEKESKVISVQGNGTWVSNRDNTTYYKFEVAFENGDSGEYSSKSQDQNKFVIGQVAKYTIFSGQYGTKIKPVYASSGGSFGGKKTNTETDKQIARMNALGHAMTMLSHQHINPTQVEYTANKFFTYITTGKMDEAEMPQPNLPQNQLS